MNKNNTNPNKGSKQLSASLIISLLFTLLLFFSRAAVAIIDKEQSSEGMLEKAGGSWSIFPIKVQRENNVTYAGFVLGEKFELHKLIWYAKNVRDTTTTAVFQDYYYVFLMKNNSLLLYLFFKGVLMVTMSYKTR